MPKITELTAAVSAAGADLMPLVQGGVTKKVNVSAIRPAIARNTTLLTHNTSTTETDLVRFALPTTAVAGDLFRLVFSGELLVDTANQNFTWRVYLGTTLVLNSGVLNHTFSASRRKYMGTIDVVVVSTTSQRIAGEINVSNPVSDTFVPLDQARSVVGAGTAAVDLTVAKDLAVTMQHGSANATQETTMRGAHLLHFRV